LAFISAVGQVILSPVDDLTRILNQVGGDGRIAADQLLPLVYQKLRQVASDKMRGGGGRADLQATALVHEAWLRVGGEAQGWQSRWHFFSAAAEAMRRILIDRARSKRANRHGGGLERVDIDGVEIVGPAEESELLDVHDALDAFEVHHPAKAELVKLRYFAGLSPAGSCEVIGISTPTAERHWAFARVWLFREIKRKQGGGAAGSGR
jgi:RNA polymerase sigma factor (TIGR02999 family)